MEIRGSLLARNTLLNFVGQAVPLLIGVITIPFIIRGLGTERFGLLSLAWVILGYFAIFDLGLGRATTKFVAEALGKDAEDQVPRLVWTAVIVQAIFGIVGAFIWAGITPLLVERILNIPPELVSEAKNTFYLLALSVPVILISSSFKGVLEASQRFDLVNAIKIPSNILTFVLPLIGLQLGFTLPGIVALILTIRFGMLAAFVAINFRIIPELKRYSSSFSLFPCLFSFGIWVMVNSIVGPILRYLGPFLIGSLLTLAAVTYYTAPFEAVTRLWIIPTSLTMTLFPAFSALEGIKNKQKVSILFARSIKYILLVLGPFVIVICLFAREILQIWLGSDFALQSTRVLQILVFAVLINSLADIPSALLQGVGRPDLVAKFQLIELPVYIGIAWFMINNWGITGAAGAWAIRIILDALLLFGAVFKVYRLSPRLLDNSIRLISFSLVILIGISYVLQAITRSLSLVVQFLLITVLVVLFFLISWKKVIDDSDRRAILKVIKPKIISVSREAK